MINRLLFDVRSVGLVCLCSALAAVVFAGCSPGNGGGEIRLRVTDDVLMEAPKRLGINIGPSASHGDQQIAAQPLTHGGFHKGRMLFFLRVGESQGNRLSHVEGDTAALTGSKESMAGGTFYVATGEHAGTKGAILEHAPGSAVFTLDLGNKNVAPGEYVWLRGPLTNRAEMNFEADSRHVGIGGFQPEINPPGKIGFVEHEADPEDQFLRMNFPIGIGQETGRMRHPIRYLADTDYTVRIRARSDAPGATLFVYFRHFGIEDGTGRAIRQLECASPDLTPEWRDYVFTGTTEPLYQIEETDSAIGFMAGREVDSEAQHVDIDYIMIEDSRLTTETGFNREVVQALREAKCGALRFFGIAGFAASVESFTASSTTDASWAYLPDATYSRFIETGAVLDDCLLLTEDVGAEAWFTVGSSNTPDDWYNLISYLSAPADFDEYSRKRAKHGHTEPWTDRVSKVYLEVGNEWWNPVFRPYFIWEPEKYAEVCKSIVDRIESHPHWDGEKIELIYGGWAANVDRWTKVVTEATGGKGSVSIAPYLLHSLDHYRTLEDKYATLFADVDDYLRHDGKRLERVMGTMATPPRVAVYELNSHITQGEAPASVASEISPSVANGIAVLDQALALMEVHQAEPIIYFTLLQRAHRNGDDVRLGLWGNLLRNNDGTLRPRPIWQGLRMANQHLIEGAMVATSLKGSPTWDQPENGSCSAIPNVPYIRTYAFLTEPDGGGRRRANVLFINRHLTQSLPVAVTLPFEPEANVPRVTLTGSDPTANNERAETVKPEEDSLDGFTQGGYVVVPPHSAVVCQFKERG